MEVFFSLYITLSVKRFEFTNTVCYVLYNMCKIAFKEYLSEDGHNKVKCTLVQALKLCTDSMARSGSRVIVLFIDRG